MRFFQIDMEKIPHGRIINVVLLVLSGMLAPYWYIFEFAPQTFKTLDLVRLLLLCLSIGLTIILINCVFLAIFSSQPAEDVFSIGNITVVCILVLAVYFFPAVIFESGKKVDLWEAVRWSLLNELLLLGILFLSAVFDAFSKRSHHANSPSPPEDQGPDVL